MLLFNRYEYNPQADIAGKGEFSRVYKAVDATNHETVAIKIYKINDLSDHYHPVKDVQLICALENQGLCQYSDIREIEKEDSFGEKEKLEVCITAFMNAGNLVSYYNSHGNPQLLKKLLLQLLDGLSYLHKKGMVHGYIKPSNLLVTETGGEAAAKITDFAMGIAPSIPSGNGSFPLMSAISYCSPEQLNAGKYGVDGKISFNTDLWSLAVVIYEVLAGEPLFKVADTDFPDTVTNRISAFELPGKVHTFPEPFTAFLGRCLVKDAGQRAQTVEELLPLFSQDDPVTKNILQLEETPASPVPSEELTMLAATEENENTADTRIIALPKKDRSPATEPVKESSDEDTRIIVNPVIPEPAGNSLSNEESTKEDEDATRFIAKPVTPQTEGNNASKEEPAKEDEDATRFIAKPAALQTAGNHLPKEEPAITEDAPIDQTIIITKINKEKQSADKDGSIAAGNKSKPTADEEKQPDVIIRRREKPVMLFNRYEYLPATDLIGKGGFSRVYKAYDKKLSRWVALKIYKTGEFSERYSPIAEIKRVVNLDHSNICRYLDIEEIENENPFGENEKIQVCVMELLDSGNFAEYYKTNKNPDTLKKLIQDILNGLSYLHKNGIIHRDIKPANILIKQTIEGPVAKITDFGISKNSEAENNNSSSALIVSIPYMAPEQLNAKKYGINEKVSFNLDLWSLGVTIYEVVTGKVLFKNSEQDNSEQIMANIMAPELPEKLNDLPEPFRAIVSHCVIKNARERASRAEELMVLLNTSTAPANTTAVMASQAANTNPVAEKETLVPRQPETGNSKPTPPAPAGPAPEKSIPSRFSVAEPEEKPVTYIEKKKNNSLFIFIGAASVIFILFIIYLKACNRPPAGVNVVDTQKADTAHAKPVPAVIPADTAHKNTVAAEKKADSVVKQKEEVAKPVHVNEKKKEKTIEETRKKEAAPTEKTNSSTAAKYMILLSVENTCTLKVNAMPYGEIQNGKPLRIYLTTGKYVLEFTSSSNSASTYTANIEVKPENLGHADKFKIPIK